MSYTSTVSDPKAISFIQLVALRLAVKLEVSGLKKRGTPATVIARQRFGIKAKSKQGVLDAMTKIVEEQRAITYAHMAGLN